ncbi:hypothetical protein GobsT_59860 [Gemmata obscuriglobus]|uniref:Uncharacterized protein n=1 Tax=Gemmata obscuriglobus TaxID=114 RepID=A0A2Z3GVX7_9BACT|nr:hypothetical protein [Gemmata obscuriglobus]AWM36232.1 hypothetical protein C1280_03870 [Gemmata obscuriglobus]QEG31165.1 hypothetical protein GobsT_59860 [Gemmata obscuriglobus]VTS10503.1 unnamed protein product [Gemmata obscuriglobus UQM 2246]
MICEVNGEPALAYWISYLELGFGGPVERQLYPYALKFEVAEVCGLIAVDANTFVQEMKLDFERTSDSYPQYLHDLGYPSIDNLVQNEGAFCETIRRYLYSELFGRCFPWSPPYRDVRWIISSVDAVRAHSGVIEVLGQAFRKVESHCNASR